MRLAAAREKHSGKYHLRRGTLQSKKVHSWHGRHIKIASDHGSVCQLEILNLPVAAQQEIALERIGVLGHNLNEL